MREHLAYPRFARDLAKETVHATRPFLRRCQAVGIAPGHAHASALRRELPYESASDASGAADYHDLLEHAAAVEVLALPLVVAVVQLGAPHATRVDSLLEARVPQQP